MTPSRFLEASPCLRMRTLELRGACGGSILRELTAISVSVRLQLCLNVGFWKAGIFLSLSALRRKGPSDPHPCSLSSPRGQRLHCPPPLNADIMVTCKQKPLGQVYTAFCGLVVSEKDATGSSLLVAMAQGQGPWTLRA